MASRRFSKCLLYADSVIFTSSELEQMKAVPPSDASPDSEPLPSHDRFEEVPASDKKESPDPDRVNELQTMLEAKQRLVLTSLLNLSLCDQKIGRNLKALDHATRALTIEPDNVKALYRKAMVSCWRSSTSAFDFKSFATQWKLSLVLYCCLLVII